MRWTCLLLACFVVTLLPVRAGHTPPKILLRVHVQTTGEGQSPLEAMTVSLPPDGEQIQVRTMPEVTEEQIIAVQRDPSGTVRLQFNHSGQVALSAVTAQNQGRILVVEIDGYIVYAPIIDQQITTGELDLPGRIKPQVVQLLQEVAQKNAREAQRS